MPSFFEFCISRDGQFYLRIRDEFAMQSKALTMLKDLRTRFPESEGFKVELSRWECSGHAVKA
jgi:hypothetical protein